MYCHFQEMRRFSKKFIASSAVSQYRKRDWRQRCRRGSIWQPWQMGQEAISMALSVIIKKKSNFSGNLLVSRERLETKVQKAKHILCLGDYRGAIEFHQQSLCSYRERDWRKRLRRKSICNFGIAYYCLGDYKKAIEFHQQSLSIAKEIGEKDAER